MTGVSIAVSAGVVLAVSLFNSLLRGRRRRTAHPAKALIVDLADSTTLDRDSGAVCSVQEADLLVEEAAVRAIWTPVHLERLARTYWRFLTRVTLGLIRIHYER